MNLENIFYDSDEEHPVNNNSNNDNNCNSETSCWVFGYGSLCWYPGFAYSKCITGYIRGFSRRFYQGSISHRGTSEKPGRVATLIEDKEGITWGCAYKITGDTALEYLKQREITLGGYYTLESKFFPRIASCDNEFGGEAFPVLIYIATEKNSLWLGESSVQSIAQQICESSGSSGHNIEYLIRLAEFMRNEIPNAYDDHLFDLERYALDILNEMKIPLYTVMGANPQRIRRDSHEGIHQPTTFEFTSRVPERKLRCLNI